MKKTTVKQPLVSICIPTFNGDEYLEQALESIVCQTYKNIEVVVSDDGSKDKTISLIAKFKKQVTFPVNLFIHHPQGIGANWNNCIKEANGEYIKFLFQDDILFPTCIQELLELAESVEGVGIVGCKRSIIVEGEITQDIKIWLKKYGDLQKGYEIEEAGYYLFNKQNLQEDKFIRNNKIGEPSTVLFKKSVLTKTGFFNENLVQVLDFEFYFRLLKFSSIIILNKKLAAFRLHPTQATNLNRDHLKEDYNRFNEILYKDFYSFLGPKTQKKLFKKYHWIGKLYSYITHNL